MSTPYVEDSSGDEIEYEGPPFRQVPDSVSFHPELKDVDVRVYIALQWFGRNGKAPFPGRKALALKIHKRSTRTVDESLGRLATEGLLTIIPRYREDGGRRSNLYRLHHTPVPPDKRRGRPPVDQKKTATEENRSSDPSAENCTGGKPGIQDTAQGAQISARGGVQKIARGPAQISAPPPGRNLRSEEIPTGRDTKEGSSSGDSASAPSPAGPTASDGGGVQPSHPAADSRQAALDGMPLVPQPRATEEAKPATLDDRARDLVRRYWDWLKSGNGRPPAELGDDQGRGSPYVRLVAMVRARLRQGWDDAEIAKVLAALYENRDITFPTAGQLDQALNAARKGKQIGASQFRPANAPRIIRDDSAAGQAERDRMNELFTPVRPTAGGTR